MEKAVVLVLIILFVSIFAAYFLSGMGITGMFIGFGQPIAAEWWNISWQYRVKLEINSTQYSRTDWPIEYDINFTDLIPSGTFDDNSTRVIEYDQVGNVLYELPSQFDKGDNYDASTNAVGTLVFLMNGTTGANSNRTFFVYYDTVENGAKVFPNYDSSGINYSWDGQKISVNNTYLSLFIDTNRGENTSGLYRAEDIYENVIVSTLGSERTVEYLEYFNGTHNLTFDLINNAYFVNGCIRLTIIQVGDEIVFGESSQKTDEGNITKKYHVYSRVGTQGYGTFIKIWQRYANNATSQIQRNSTPSGALAFDLNRTLNSGYIHKDSQNVDKEDPFSWVYGGGSGGEMVGIINLEETGTLNYYSTNNSFTPGYGRVGIQLNSTYINSGSYVEQKSLIYFSAVGGSDAVTEFYNIRDRFENPITISQFLPEVLYVIIAASTNETVYNRNETVLIVGNISNGDPYNVTEYMNATLDMGTPSPADDQTIELYDYDGDRVFNNTFQIPNYGTVGVWTVNITAYSNESVFLNSTTTNLNVTDFLNVNLTVLNDKPLAGEIVIANISVQNYRNDSWEVGATINCSYDSTEVTNKTDYNDGTYSVNFTAPAVETSYLLYCNATKNNNTGNNNDTFAVEASKISVSIETTPENVTVSQITFYDNETFEITTNATNKGNGTAYNTNISLELLSGWVPDTSLKQCNDIEKGANCTRLFNITVPNNTSPDNYTLNVTATWRNPDDTISSNKTSFNVTVEPNPKLNLSEDVFIGEAGDGSNIHVGNFTVFSIGNYILQNISFDCFEGTVCVDFFVNFTPINISSIPVGDNESVAINVTVPLGYTVGNYTGTVNVSADNANYKNLTLNISVQPKTNISITAEPANYTAMGVNKYNNETFSINTTLTNIEKGSARYTNVSLSVPTNWVYEPQTQFCNNITSDNNCTKNFNITIPNGTYAGNYLINITANWTDPDNSLGTNTTSFNVTVSANAVINITPTFLSGTIGDGKEENIGSFTIVSIGNTPLQNVGFNCFEGTVCSAFTVNFTPNTISSIPVDDNESVAINVTVPLGYTVGNYTGTVNVSADNANYKNLTLNISVPSNRTWTMDKTLCQKSEYTEVGTACEVTVSNLGNDLINFTITPIVQNKTDTNVTNFTVNGWQNYTFNVTYNITGYPQAVYNSSYLVDAVQPNSNPDSMGLNVTLLPHLPPLINFTIVPNETEQNESVEIFANITDMSTTGISWVNITVKRPDDTIDESNMSFVSQSGSLTQWYFKYPDYMGDTNLRGFYNVTVRAEDKIGNLGNETKNLTIYKKLIITSTTLTNKYLQGDTGSIYYSSKNISGYGEEDVNVTFKIFDSGNNISFYTERQTNEEGIVSPMPGFSLASDAITGCYTLVSNSSFYDPIVNKIITHLRNSTFEVQQRTVTVTGLFADLETAVAWYPDNIMRFGILVYNGEGRPVDPDDMNLTVFDPADNVYFIATLSEMTRESEGFYTYSYAMGAGTAVGMYLGVINATQDTFHTMKLKSFRVSQGGPYDVRLVPFEYEVPQGTYFDFLMIVENKGTVSQDVFIEYEVTNLDGTASYYYAAEAVYTPAGTNQSFTRHAYVFSNQPLGIYVLSVKVTFDYIQPSIIANASFLVKEGITRPEPPTIPITAGQLAPIYREVPTERISASILISDYNNNITAARGFTKIESATVKNNGLVDLSNINLFVLGVPSIWFNITPESYGLLSPEESTVFLIEFKIPRTVIPGEYRASLLATSGLVSDQKSITITVYESIKDLLEIEIKKLKEDLLDLQVDTKIAEKEGKDVSSVLLFIERIESQISEAEDDIKNNEPERAMDKISNAANLIKKARDVLRGLEVPEPILWIPIWVVFILLIIIIVVVFVIVYLWRKKKLKPILRPYILTLNRVVESIKKKEVSKDKLRNEREKLLRMLEVLERERNEGLVTIKAYNKLKKSLEDKLNKVEKKLK